VAEDFPAVALAAAVAARSKRMVGGLGYRD
jgi:hypothetical protein